LIKLVCFDLDGTLLPMDQGRFIKGYIEALATKVASVTPAQPFIDALLEATAVMVRQPEAGRRNEERFWNQFYRRLPLPENDLKPLIDEFYRQDFDVLQQATSASAAAAEAVKTVRKAGRIAVLATNPLFPRLAVEKRVAWAGIAIEEFSHITTYESEYYCKPDVRYYQGVLNRQGVLPEECLMVGNDVEEDLIAGTIGVQTVLVTDCLINAKGLPETADHKVTLQQLPTLLQNLLR
jgi:FMN phosphatase YigB (HAD superfamily)